MGGVGIPGALGLEKSKDIIQCHYVATHAGSVNVPQQVVESGDSSRSALKGKRLCVQEISSAYPRKRLRSVVGVNCSSSIDHQMSQEKDFVGRGVSSQPSTDDHETQLVNSYISYHHEMDNINFQSCFILINHTY